MTLKVIHLLPGFLNGSRRTSVQRFAKFRLARASRGACVIAELVASGLMGVCRVQYSVLTVLVVIAEVAGIALSAGVRQHVRCLLYTSDAADE